MWFLQVNSTLKEPRERLLPQTKPNLSEVFLFLADAETPIHTFNSPRLDCEVFLSRLLCVSTNSCHMVPSAAARIFTKTRQFDHDWFIFFSFSFNHLVSFVFSPLISS